MGVRVVAVPEGLLAWLTDVEVGADGRQTTVHREFRLSGVAISDDEGRAILKRRFLD